MGDSVSMIFFTVSDEYTQNLHTAPRITREIFCYKDNVLLQSRLYPTDLEDQKTLYRSIVQQAMQLALTSRTCGRSSEEKKPNPTVNLQRTATIIPTINMDMRLHLY